jgi:putative spermidine/putrescine transport system permease protein
LTAAGNPAVSTVGRPAWGGRRLPLSWLGTVPFFGYVAIFLLLPTVIIGVGSFLTKDGAFTLSNLNEIHQKYVVTAFINGFVLSIESALIGAVGGALLAYAVVTGNPNGVLRRLVSSACGVLAQFGGVTLAFAFIAAIGPVGIVYLFMQQHGIDIYPNGAVWLYKFPGLVLVYTYFQIPLMVLVFMPALDGIKPQWREATETLGGGTWHYWRYVAGPLLLPAFTGATLLLFANAFSAYATAAALINQGSIIITLLIGHEFSSEVGLSNPGIGDAQSLAMIVVVAIVMVSYSLLQRRTSRWLQ